MARPSPDLEWHPSACILCECNCGVQVQVEDRSLVSIRGDESHPSSVGYTCEKALRLDHYQSNVHRLTSPLRRRPDGTHEKIDWDTAIVEIAERLAAVRDEHGGERIFFYGGGGQGNHLGGVYNKALQAALGVRYISNALAQEKSGEMYVDGRMYGGHTKGDFEHAEVVVFVGKNPWQSHSFPRARPVLREIQRDPERTMIVIDPRVSETARIADLHLQVRPGTDAWCLSALGAVIVQEGLVDHDFLAEHTAGVEDVLAALSDVDVSAHAERCGIDEKLLRTAARRIGTASSAVTYEDLGIQQAPNSTLSSYLNKLLWILTGNFGKPGAMYLHSVFAPVAGGGGPRRKEDSEEASGGEGSGARTTPVTGARIIAGLVPCNSIAEEILTDHPDRFRAMWIDSVNPAHSLADSARFIEAMEALDLTVVVDIAMTETARHADYVLPASSQFEKWESTFFNVEFPENVYHLRRPMIEPLEGTLPEPEIYARVIRTLATVADADLDELRRAAETGRSTFAPAFFAAVAADPALVWLAPYLLFETLGPTLPDGARSASALWAVSHLVAMTNPDAVARAGFTGDGFEPGEKLFERIMTGEAVVFTRDRWEDVWNYVKRPDRRFTVEIPSLLDELRGLADTDGRYTSEEFPLVLSAGERRSFTANTIYRDPEWRRRDAHGALRVSQADADSLGVETGDRVRVMTAGGSAEATVEVSDMMRAGHISLPNGMGVDHPDDNGRLVRAGVAPNELTSIEHRDHFAGTPLHKHVPARIEPLSAAVNER